MTIKLRIFSLVLFLSLHHSGFGQVLVVDSLMHYLRNGEAREWSDFPAKAKRKLLIEFTCTDTMYETLSVRQLDVKQDWQVFLNDHPIGMLTVDEKDLVAYFSIPQQSIQKGKNILSIRTGSPVIDDIRVSQIKLYDHPIANVLAQASVELEVFEKKSNTMIPSRLTIMNRDGSLQTVSTSDDQNIVVRTGYVYTGNGRALIQLPAGDYTIYAGRGFEYGVDSASFTVEPGEHVQKKFVISKEIETNGWISSDTHIHTVTYSRHGDATDEERAVTIAGEGIEFPVMTDHNLYVDLDKASEKRGVLKWFTAVTGDEVTTQVGHFNVFPIDEAQRIIDHRGTDWNLVGQQIGGAGKNKVVILNHARDIHNNFRPFDITRHVSTAGIYRDAWQFPANAMEVVNSGSQQSDIMLLFNDWFGMLNGGHNLTPIGSSDSHDVSRFTVGQGRTYIQCNDDEPGKINVVKAAAAVLEGRVLVSCGLLTKIFVNKIYTPGDLVQAKHKTSVSVEVHGPSWARADHVRLYMNGTVIRDEKIEPTKGRTLKWKGSWDIDLPDHDVFLVAIAEGPGNGMPYWPIAKPYQPVSSEWKPRVIGSTGAVWVDGDQSGVRNSANDYGKLIMRTSRGSIHKIVKRLASFDEAVAVQVAVLMWRSGENLSSPSIASALTKASAQTKRGFEKAMAETKHIK